MKNANDQIDLFQEIVSMNSRIFLFFNNEIVRNLSAKYKTGRTRIDTKMKANECTVDQIEWDNQVRVRGDQMKHE